MRIASRALDIAHLEIGNPNSAIRNAKIFGLARFSIVGNVRAFCTFPAAIGGLDWARIQSHLSLPEPSARLLWSYSHGSFAPSFAYISGHHSRAGLCPG